jgi:hypothetical protein
MIELRMRISIDDGNFIKSDDKTIQNRVYREYYEIDLSKYSIDTISKLLIILQKSLNLCMIQIKRN